MRYELPPVSQQDLAVVSRDEREPSHDSGRQIPKADLNRNQHDIEMALKRLASHDILRKSPKLLAFLNYVVGETVAGRGDRLKAYSIGVAALGKHSAFDPSADPIVRVEATRLRRSLNVYYADAGKHDPIQIKMPPGSYQPIFERCSAGPVAERQNTRNPDLEPIVSFAAMAQAKGSTLFAFLTKGIDRKIISQIQNRTPRILYIINLAIVLFAIVFGYRVLIEIENLNKRIDQLDIYWEKHLALQTE